MQTTEAKSLLKVLRYLGLGYAIYVALALVVIFPLLNLMAPKLIQTELGREFRASSIVFNPFTVALHVRNGEFFNPDGSFFLGWGKIGLNLSVSSIWSSGIVFDDIELEDLHAEVERASDGTFNFADLLSSSAEQGKSDTGTAIPGITIGHLALHAERIGFVDHARESVFATYIEGIGIAIKNLSTVHESDEPYSLHATAEGGGELHWNGQISLPSAKSSGTLSLNNINLIALSRFAEPWVNFQLPSGRLAVGGEYSVDWKKELNYRIEQGSVQLTDLSIIAKHPDLVPDSSVDLERLSLTNVELDSTQQKIGANNLTVLGLNIQGWSEGDRTSLVEIFAAKTSDQTEDPAQAADEDVPGWSAALRQAEIQTAQLQWRSQYTSPELLSITPIDIRVGPLTWPPKGPSEVDIGVVLNSEATVTIDGSFDIGSGNGNVLYAVENLPLALFNPNLPDVLDATIGKGLARAQGSVSVAEFAPSKIDSEGTVSDFSINVAEAENALTSWKSVRWKGLSVNLSEQLIHLENLAINGYSGRLHIFSDGTINAQRLLRENESTAIQKTEPEIEATPWSFDLPLISIANSQIDFMDESLPIQFRTVIGDLNGEVSELSSQTHASTSINLAGTVDGYAPVLLQGSASVFKDAPELDLSLSFKGMDIAGLTPYTGNYAGYAIDRGILNLDLAYTLEQAHLVGANKIVIEQLKLGEKVASEQAVDLPLGLAIALLTDLNGVIDIDLPISGNVDNPDFSIGSIVFGAFVNLITKAVTAPFSLLAGLIGSEDDLQRINFESGSAELNERSIKQILTLADALSQRPGLNLTISGRLELQRDTQLLARKIFSQKLLKKGLSKTQINQQEEPWENVITALYVELDGSIDPAEIGVAQQHQQLIQATEVDQALLEQLLHDRAAEVKRYLVNEAGLEAGRAVIETVNIDDEANLFSGAELGLSN